MYVCFNFKYIELIYTFGTEIYYSIKNYVHNVKTKPHQEVEDGYIFVKTVMPVCRRLLRL